MQNDTRKEKLQPKYNYSREYGRTVLTDVRRLHCRLVLNQYTVYF